MGNFARKVNFSARGSVTLPVGTLSDSVTADDSCLVYVHSLFQTPKVRDLRLAWDEADPLFEGIWK